MGNLIKEYFNTVKGVSHTTFNPKGPGVLRIHLIPPKKLKLGVPWVIILNGQDILPISAGWAILLRIFIDKVNLTHGEPISDQKLKGIIEITLDEAKRIFTKTPRKMLKDDLREIVLTLVDVAEGKKPLRGIGYMTLREYGKYMQSPHRMDLMISSMMKDNHWHCNQKCLHCYAGVQENAIVNELNTESWKEIIDKCKDASISQITFTGGEPTLRSDLVELIKYSEWFVTRLNTNGVLLTKELCSQLYEASLDSVQVTLYSHQSHIHNLLVGASNFDRTIDGIRNAIAAGLNVSVNTPLCTLNRDYLETVRYLHKELGVNYFTCSGLIVTGKAVENDSQNTQLNENDLVLILKDVTKYVIENELDINFTSPGWISNDMLVKLKLMVPSCGACLSNMAITPNGNVVPCQSWLTGDTLGNLLSDEWKTIWNSKKCKAVRKQSQKIDYLCPLTLKNKKENK